MRMSLYVVNTNDNEARVENARVESTSVENKAKAEREAKAEVCRRYMKCMKKFAVLATGHLFEQQFDGKHRYGFKHSRWQLGGRCSLYYNKKEVSENEMLMKLVDNDIVPWRFEAEINKMESLYRENGVWY